MARIMFRGLGARVDMMRIREARMRVRGLGWIG